MMDVLFFKIALALYLLSTAGYIASLLVRRVLAAKVSTWILLSAFAVQGLSIFFRYVRVGHTPVIGLHDSLSFFVLAMTGTYLAFQLKTKTRVLGAFVSPIAFFMMMVASVSLGGDVSLPDILKGGLVPFHAILSITGEALFALACCAGAMYLIQDGFIKHRHITAFSRLLPPLRDLDRISHVSLLWGFPLLTLGAIAGALWARTVWGSHWSWDPKQVWTLMAWLLYALVLHQRLAIGWNGRKAALLSIGALFLMLAALIGVNVFFTTAHRFFV
jgi:cytochrome c-type biogenesis protein CcsB